jgi:hypothetical protein
VESLAEIRPRLPQRAVGTEPSEPAHQGIDVAIGLFNAPLFGRVVSDLEQICFRPFRQPVAHFFARRSRPAALIRSASLGSSSAS